MHKGYKLQAMSYELQATSYELRATSYELQAMSYELRATSYVLCACVACIPYEAWVLRGDKVTEEESLTHLQIIIFLLLIGSLNQFV
jgi:hypothetical protein